jgi:hypothetical protein
VLLHGADAGLYPPGLVHGQQRGALVGCTVVERPAAERRTHVVVVEAGRAKIARQRVYQPRARTQHQPILAFALGDRAKARPGRPGKQSLVRGTAEAGHAERRHAARVGAVETLSLLAQAALEAAFGRGAVACLQNGQLLAHAQAIGLRPASQPVVLEPHPQRALASLWRHGA